MSINSDEDEGMVSIGDPSSGGSRQTDESDKEGQEHLSKDETRAVFRLRVLVILVILSAAAAVSIVVYVSTKQGELDTFESQYEGASTKVLEAFEDIVLSKLGAASSLAVATIAHGVDHFRTWPFVTLSSFQQRSSTALEGSKGIFSALLPLVTAVDREEWERFVIEDGSWIAEGVGLQQGLGIEGIEEAVYNPYVGLDSTSIKDPDGTRNPGPGPYLPVWQTSPILENSPVNIDQFRLLDRAIAARECLDSGAVSISRFRSAPPGTASSSHPETAFYAALLSMQHESNVEYTGEPVADVFLPVFNTFSPDRVPVAVMWVIIKWASYFDQLLPPNILGITVVLENSCDEAFTYEINGGDVVPIGSGDLHDNEFDRYERSTSFQGLNNIADGTKTGLSLLQGEDQCQYLLRVYPSQVFYNEYVTNTPVKITCAVAFIFLFTTLLFLVYDRLVERRQRLLLSKAERSTAIVSSLFPRNVRDRLMQEHSEKGKNSGFLASNQRLKSFLNGDLKDNEEPIADLFPNCTVMFADIAGFTAWSSTRDPKQVFVLLQTVYQAFDEIAKRRRVFKVETIGDSYVAATGLPEPQESHALIMARFASDCMQKMNELMKVLEVSLGPDTADLSMRFGLHSGQVTAGVLRGERARFQLFGDTVNTAARMESTGIRGKIQVSGPTAELLSGHGKDHWLKPREDAVNAKGKGLLKTFWLEQCAKKKGSSTTSSEAGSRGQIATPFPASDREAMMKQGRLVDWITDLLGSHIRKIIAKGGDAKGTNNRGTSSPMSYEPAHGTTCIDEIVEIISMPKFDEKAAIKGIDHHSVEIDPVVARQLRDYVSIIASTYRDNPFHNFEHACHVTMSVDKLLNRIVAPDLSDEEIERAQKSRGQLASCLHDYTHGINSDPLSSLAIVFSALIHDADHRGVSNAQLVKEDKRLANMYGNQSVAEQNSLDIAWALLMSEQFDELRKCIFANKAELRRFRQVLVNVVLATDIFDKELNDLRKARWEKAFSSDVVSNKDVGAFNDLRATIVIEHIIQASDVAHTMQHWHIYRKWNKRLFKEMYLAYLEGMGPDPSTFWYKGELGFFDNYIIPLAKKLKNCNVFGVSSDEYLQYAMLNRQEWEQKGAALVAEMMTELSVPSTPDVLQEQAPARNRLEL